MPGQGNKGRVPLDGGHIQPAFRAPISPAGLAMMTIGIAPPKIAILVKRPGPHPKCRVLVSQPVRAPRSTQLVISRPVRENYQIRQRFRLGDLRKIGEKAFPLGEWYQH